VGVRAGCAGGGVRGVDEWSSRPFILLFESLWKLIWLGVVALPAVVAGDVDEAVREVIVNCSVVVIVFAVVPWRYVWQRYVAAKGDRWRGAAA
jgi:hypothetical protein